MSTIKNWGLHLVANKIVTVVPENEICIANVSLGIKLQNKDQRCTLLIKFDQDAPFFSVCSFVPGRSENHRCDLVLFAQNTYELQVCGDNSIDLLGTIEILDDDDDPEDAVNESNTGAGAEEPSPSTQPTFRKAGKNKEVVLDATEEPEKKRAGRPRKETDGSSKKSQAQKKTGK